MGSTERISRGQGSLFSSFGKWLAPICTQTFTDRIAESSQDKYVKKLTTPAYLKLFLHAQLQGQDGLRDIADDVLCKEFQQELGLDSVNAMWVKNEESALL